MVLKRIFIGLATALFSVLLYVGFQPSAYFIYREISIVAPAEVVFPYLYSTKMADEWMPWKDIDPNVKMSYSGPDGGVGSTSSWESSGQMGVGKAEVVEAIQNKKIRTKISYTKPMEFSQTSEFLLTANGSESRVRWSVEGNNSFLGRLMCFLTLMDMDKYIGGEFEKGLKKLKTLVERKK